MFQIFLFNFVHFLYFSEILMANIIHEKKNKEWRKSLSKDGERRELMGFFKKNNNNNKNRHLMNWYIGNICYYVYQKKVQSLKKEAIFIYIKYKQA